MKIIVRILIVLNESAPEVYDKFRKNAISKSVTNKQ